MNQNISLDMAQMLADQLKINAHFWASLQALASALTESDPNFRERLDKHLAEPGESEFVRLNSAVPELVRKMRERLKV